jgi:ABC-2 type transport system ATP-binding protein
MQMIELQELEIGSADFRLRIPLAQVRAGTAAALIGKNGSGKTTLLESLLGLRKPFGGRVAIEGRDAADWLASLSNKRRMGVQLQSMTYPTKTRVREVLRLHSVVYACRPEPSTASAFDMNGIADRYYEHLSRGEKQRVDLYVALAHGPELIVLDEPCTGLDAKYHERALALMASLCERPDKTVLFATHDARELRLARALLWIDAGVVRQTTVAEALERLGQYCGELAVRHRAQEAVDEVLAHTSNLPALTTAKSLGGQRVLAFGNGAAFKAAFEELARRFDLPHTLRLVSHEDLLRATANGARD